MAGRWDRNYPRATRFQAGDPLKTHWTQKGLFKTWRRTGFPVLQYFLRFDKDFRLPNKSSERSLEANCERGAMGRC